MLGDPVTDLSLSGELDYFRLARDRYFVPFSVKIPGFGNCSGQEQGQRADGTGIHRSVARRAHQAGGRGARRHQDQTGGADGGQLASRPIAYDTGFTVPPGKYTLKFLARENETGKMGTYETKFAIPDLAPDKPRC